MKKKLNVDLTDSSTVADSDKVITYPAAPTGEPITSTARDGKQGQDVYVINKVVAPPLQGTVAVGAAAVEAKVGGAALAGRTHVRIHNKGPQTIYFGPTSGVTTATGEPLFRDQTVTVPFGAAAPVYLIAAGGGQTAIVWELTE